MSRRRGATRPAALVGAACASALVLAAVGAAGAPRGAPRDVDAVDFTFVVVGCDRVDRADTAGNSSTANLPQLERTFREVAALRPAPAFFFFDGDLVFGYTPDTVRLAAELRAWRAVAAASPLATAGVELVPIPGNHETQSAPDARSPTRRATAAAERTWQRAMAGALGHSGNGPGAGDADSLATDQSRLTYSFDYHGTHFLLLNTDPTGQDAHVPSRWIASDLARARADHARHIFAIGHKPAYAYPSVPSEGLSAFPAARDAFWEALVANRAEAMFAAHNHVYYRWQPATGGTWQIIAGNAGSVLLPHLLKKLRPRGNYYGYTLVTVRRNGRVLIASYGRDVPAEGYNAAAPESRYPTTLRDSAEITWH